MGKKTLMPKVSIVIPCYNHGKFIQETIDSILNSSFKDFEIIIINDGSTDSFTNELLKTLHPPKTRILEIPNSGPATARNTGIQNSLGQYILPLDADDKIHPEYIEKSVEILDNNPNLGIVYCQASFFGAIEGRWHLPSFKSIRMLLKANVIFSTAFYRKEDWILAGGYNPKMKIGWEDYDFWITLLSKTKKTVCQIPEILFYYRVFEISRSYFANQKEYKLRLQIILNHKLLYLKLN